MRLVQFIKWYWNDNDWFNRTIAVAISWVLPCLLSIVFVGKIGVLMAFFGLATIAISWLVYGIFYFFRDLWREFDDAVPTPEVAIVRRLKGIPTPAGNKQAEYYD